MNSLLGTGLQQDIQVIVADLLGIWFNHMVFPDVYFQRATTSIREIRIGPPYICCSDVNALNNRALGWEK
jgi:hypothetical protein